MSIRIVGPIVNRQQLQYTQNGTAILKYTIKTTTQKKDPQSGNYKNAPFWVNVVEWGKAAEGRDKIIDRVAVASIIAEPQSDDNGNIPVFQRKDGTPGAKFEVGVAYGSFVIEGWKDNNQNYQQNGQPGGMQQQPPAQNYQQQPPAQGFQQPQQQWQQQPQQQSGPPAPKLPRQGAWG